MTHWGKKIKERDLEKLKDRYAVMSRETGIEGGKQKTTLTLSPKPVSFAVGFRKCGLAHIYTSIIRTHIAVHTTQGHKLSTYILVFSEQCI